MNGADVTAFNQPARWHKVTITNNMVVNNVAGYAGGGIALADTVRAFIDNNTVASNDSTGIAGVVLANGVGLPAETPGQAGVGSPSPAGIVSEPTSAALLAQFTNNGQRSANAISQPELINNIVWKNRSFFYDGTGRLCVGNSLTDVAPGCSVLPDQSTTGQCVAGAKYWDLGVLGDANTTPGTNHLNPTYSILTSISGYSAATDHNSASDPALANQYCNGARVVPELPGVSNPPSVKNLQVAATVDEGNNYVNLSYGPLYVFNPTSGNAFGDYHLAGAAGSAYDTGTNTGAVPNHDFDGHPRPLGVAFDRGADEFKVPAPLPSVSPNPLAFGVTSINTTKTRAVTLSNGPTADQGWVLNTPTITSGNVTGRYTVVNVNCPIGGTGLLPGLSCTLNVSYTPNSLTPTPTQTSTLNVSAANAATINVALTGTAFPPTYSVTSHGFGNQLVGSVSAPFGFTVTNTSAVGSGNLEFTGSNAVVTGQFAAASGGTCTTGTSLPPGSSCTMNVTFNPTSTGLKVGTVNAPLAAGAIGLPGGATGTGVQAAVGFTWTNGGTVGAWGTATGARTITVTNTGTAGSSLALTAVPAVASLTGGTQFVRTGGTCSATTVLAQNANCTVIVTRTRPATTPFAGTGTLTVTDTGAATASQVLNLSGT